MKSKYEESVPDMDSLRLSFWSSSVNTTSTIEVARAEFSGSENEVVEVAKEGDDAEETHWNMKTVTWNYV